MTMIRAEKEKLIFEDTHLHGLTDEELTTWLDEVKKREREIQRKIGRTNMLDVKNVLQQIQLCTLILDGRRQGIFKYEKRETLLEQAMKNKDKFQA